VSSRNQSRFKIPVLPAGNFKALKNSCPLPPQAGYRGETCPEGQNFFGYFAQKQVQQLGIWFVCVMSPDPEGDQICTKISRFSQISEKVVKSTPTSVNLLKNTHSPDQNPVVHGGQISWILAKFWSFFAQFWPNFVTFCAKLSHFYTQNGKLMHFKFTFVHIDFVT
jgi:hypothetical protein